MGRVNYRFLSSKNLVAVAQDEPSGSNAWETLLRSVREVLRWTKDGCGLSKEGRWGGRSAGDCTGEPPQEVGWKGA